MKVVNNSLGKPYFTQRNNYLYPSSACNVTAMVSGLSAADWPLPKGKFAQPEDNLLNFIRENPEVQRRWDKIDPKHTIPPNQWHELLCLGTNLWLNTKRIKLYWNLLIEEVVKAIDTGGAVVMSGKFRAANSEIGHIVPVVGYQSEGSTVTHLILDDTWGDYRTLYNNHHGDDVAMAIPDYMSFIRPLDEARKWGHIVPRYTA
jgi:hypothetical protein